MSNVEDKGPLQSPVDRQGTISSLVLTPAVSMGLSVIVGTRERLRVPAYTRS